MRAPDSLWITLAWPLARSLLFALLSLGAVPAALGAPPYMLDKPEFLREPQVSTSLLGATYAYLPESAAAPERLMITTMLERDIRQQLGPISEIQCVNLFLEELRASHERFFVVSMNRPLTVGTQEFVQFRWTGDKAHETLTGILSCGKIDGTYYVIHFVDALLAATRSFPDIRTSLKTLAPRAR